MKNLPKRLEFFCRNVFAETSCSHMLEVLTQLFPRNTEPGFSWVSLLGSEQLKPKVTYVGRHEVPYLDELIIV